MIQQIECDGLRVEGRGPQTGGYGSGIVSDPNRSLPRTILLPECFLLPFSWSSCAHSVNHSLHCHSRSGQRSDPAAFQPNSEFDIEL